MSTHIDRGKLAELREKYLAKYHAGLPNDVGLPHPADLQRFHDDDVYMYKFVEQQDGIVENALQMLVDTMVWRKTFKTNELDESCLNMEYMRDGLFYPRGKDLDDCAIFVFKSKLHTKGLRNFEELKKCIVYWLERLSNVDKCDRISVFFDMEGAGLSNMDLEFTKYLIELFKYYYPEFLNYIFIYEMPWILSATFQVIKKLLPKKAVARMKFLKKDTVKNFIPAEHAHESWGGEDKYVYSFVPIAKSQSEITNSLQTEEISAKNDRSANLPAPFDRSDVALKKVTFSNMDSPESPQTEQPQQRRSNINSSYIDIDPYDCITFTENSNEVKGEFVVTNVYSTHVTYKIKTTSPEKFRVRPSAGIIGPTESVKIQIFLFEAYRSSFGREKFLVMIRPIDDPKMTHDALGDLWKNSNSDEKRHKLGCIYRQSKSSQNFNSSTEGSRIKAASYEDNSKGFDPTKNSVSDPDYNAQLLVEKLTRKQESLVTKINHLETMQFFNFFVITVLLCVILYYCGDSLFEYSPLP